MKVNESHVFILPNRDGATWLFNRDSEEFSVTALPDLNEVREKPAVGAITHADGSVEIVVAGGVSLTSTKIFNFEGNLWRNGPELPVAKDLENPAAVQYGNTFIVLGGRDYGLGDPDSIRDTLFMFDPKNDDWIQLPQKLLSGRRYCAAFLVPDDFIQCL